MLYRVVERTVFLFPIFVSLLLIRLFDVYVSIVAYRIVSSKSITKSSNRTHTLIKSAHARTHTTHAFKLQTNYEFQLTGYICFLLFLSLFFFLLFIYKWVSPIPFVLQDSVDSATLASLSKVNWMTPIDSFII